MVIRKNNIKNHEDLLPLHEGKHHAYYDYVLHENYHFHMIGQLDGGRDDVQGAHHGQNGKKV